jgi:uncharacterized ParB-like nuclease family protein
MTVISLPQEALYSKVAMRLSLAIRRDIEALSQDIAAIGLLNPLIVMKDKGRYVIIDGKKRFQAIKKLTRRKMLPRTLHKVPCIVTDGISLSQLKSPKPILLSDQDLVDSLVRAIKSGETVEEASHKYQCSTEIARKALSLESLHVKLKQAFISGTINLEQAAAFATLPNPKSQWNLLIQLGPFGNDTEIIAAISAGETVIETPGGNILILPSRAPVRPIENSEDFLKLAA